MERRISVRLRVPQFLISIALVLSAQASWADSAVVLVTAVDSRIESISSLDDSCDTTCAFPEIQNIIGIHSLSADGVSWDENMNGRKEDTQPWPVLLSLVKVVRMQLSGKFLRNRGLKLMRLFITHHSHGHFLHLLCLDLLHVQLVIKSKLIMMS